MKRKTGGPSHRSTGDVSQSCFVPRDAADPLRIQPRVIPLPSRDAMLQRAAQRAVRLFEDEGTPETQIIMRATVALFFGVGA